MHFHFTADEPKLTAARNIGGFALNAQQIGNVKRWQGNLEYCFAFHGGYHGKGDQHYVYIVLDGDTQVKNCSRVMVSTGETTGGSVGVKPKHMADAVLVEASNRDLFKTICAMQ